MTDCLACIQLFVCAVYVSAVNWWYFHLVIMNLFIKICTILDSKWIEYLCKTTSVRMEIKSRARRVFAVMRRSRSTITFEFCNEMRRSRTHRYEKCVLIFGYWNHLKWNYGNFINKEIFVEDESVKIWKWLFTLMFAILNTKSGF